MIRLIAVVSIIQIAAAVILSDEAYDDDPLFFVETHPSNFKSAKPYGGKDDHHHVLDNNYFRLSRSKSENAMPLMDDLESEYEDLNNEFARPTRSGDKNDNFVRFGRGNSDFVRFGRDPYKFERNMRGDSNFLRFGRSVSEKDTPKNRSKREIFDEKRASSSDNFLRFGKSGDDSFIRYGRNRNDESPLPTQARPLFPNDHIHGQFISPFYRNLHVLQTSPLLTILKKLEEEIKKRN